MGVDTRGLISSNWEIRNIVEVMKYHLGIEKVKVVKVPLKISEEYFKLEFEGREYSRSMNVHLNVRTAVGACTSISLGANEEAIKIIGKIVEVLGGFFEPSDCDGDYHRHSGEFDPEDGAQFFLTKLVLMNEADGVREYLEKLYNERCEPKRRKK